MLRCIEGLLVIGKWTYGGLEVENRESKYLVILMTTVPSMYLFFSYIVCILICVL